MLVRWITTRVQSHCTRCFWSNDADASVPECLAIVIMKIPHHRGSKARSYIDPGPPPVTSMAYPAAARTLQKRVAFQAILARIIAIMPPKIPQGVRSQTDKRVEIIIMATRITPTPTPTPPWKASQLRLGGHSGASSGSPPLVHTQGWVWAPQARSWATLGADGEAPRAPLSVRRVGRERG